MATKKQPKMTITKDGTKVWRLHGKLHREDGPAYEGADDGYKAWYLNGQRHREDGPAVEYADGPKFWFLNDQLHREGGPAYENANGTKVWYLNDKELTEDEFENWKFVQWCTTPVEYAGVE